MGVVVNIPEAGLDYVLYGNKNNILLNYISNQINSLPAQFNEFSQRIYNSLNTAYNHLTDRLTQYGIMNELTGSNIRVEGISIEELRTFEQLQQANVSMQRWIMANSNLRSLYQQNNIDGYSDTYVDIHKGHIGQSHYDYRRVMNNVLVTDNDGWSVYTYDDELYKGDRELEHNEKVAILHTWNAVDFMLENCKFDFTSTSKELKRIVK